MYYVIVRRGDFQKFDLLHTTFGAVTPVVWDQRVHERRRTVDPHDGEDQRHIDRRAIEPTSWTALGFVVVEREV